MTAAALWNRSYVLGWALEAHPTCGGSNTREMDNMCLCNRLQNHMGEHPRASSKMDEMTLGQILTRTCAIMSDEKESVAAAIKPVQSSNNQTSPSASALRNITCYKCSGRNHFARDCQYLRGEGRSGPRCRVRGKVRRYRWQKISYIVSECLGNRKRSATLTPVSPQSI